MSNRIIEGYKTRRGLRKHVLIPGGFTTESDGSEIITFDVYLDYTLLEAMAHDAACNKSQKSRDGALEVRVTNRKREKAQ